MCEESISLLFWNFNFYFFSDIYKYHFLALKKNHIEYITKMNAEGALTQQQIQVASEIEIEMMQDLYTRWEYLS